MKKPETKLNTVKIPIDIFKEFSASGRKSMELFPWGIILDELRIEDSAIQKLQKQGFKVALIHESHLQ